MESSNGRRLIKVHKRKNVYNVSGGFYRVIFPLCGFQSVQYVRFISWGLKGLQQLFLHVLEWVTGSCELSGFGVGCEAEVVWRTDCFMEACLVAFKGDSLGRVIWDVSEFRIKPLPGGPDYSLRLEKGFYGRIESQWPSCRTWKKAQWRRRRRCWWYCMVSGSPPPKY